LRRYADEWAALSGVPVDFHSRGVTARRLAPELETALYRITREALTNVVRHAKARRVSVLLERRADHVLLIVEDDAGASMRALLRAPAAQGKLGLLGMQERATLAGGAVEFESNRAPAQPCSCACRRRGWLTPETGDRRCSTPVGSHHRQMLLTDQ